MKIEYRWLLENRVLYAQLTGRLSMTELEESTNYILNLLKQDSSEKLHILYQMDGLQPSGKIGELAKLNREVLKHPKMGWILSYGLDNKVTEFIFRVVVKTLGAKVKFLENHEAALDFLRVIDPQIQIAPH